MNIKDIDPLKLLQILQQGVVVHAPSTEIVYANPKALELLRLSEDQALGKGALDPEWRFIDTQHKVMSHQHYPVNRVLAEKRSVSNIEIGICDSTTDRITWVLCNAFPQFNASGEISEIVVGFLDISAMRMNIPFEAVVAHANDIILITEASGTRIVYVNAAFCELTGYSSDEVIGKTPSMLQGIDTSVETRQRIRDALDKEMPVREKILNYSKSGTPYWLDMNIFPLQNEFGDVSYYAAVERDITTEVENEANLHDLATKDPLTGLLNRRGFHDLANKKLLAQAQQKESTIAMIDVDYFKKINDTFGHEGGDRALKSLADHLRMMFRESDLLCRIGGEEFAVMLPGAGIDVSKKKMEQFREKLASSSLEIDDQQSTKVTVSIGLARCDTSSFSIEEVLNRADKALYEAKNSGRNRTISAD